MSKSILLALAVYFLVIPSQIWAASCKDIFRENRLSMEFQELSIFKRSYLKVLEDSDVLNQADEIEIGRFFKNYPEETAVKKAYDLFLKARIRLIEEPVRSSITNFERQRVFQKITDMQDQQASLVNATFKPYYSLTY